MTNIIVEWGVIYGKQYAKTVAVIFKNNKFENYSAQETLDIPSDKTEEIYKLVIEIFDKSWKKDPIRLIGVRLSNFTDTKEQQLSLFSQNSNDNKKNEDIQKIIDNINEKYGNSAIMTATLKKITNK